MKTLQNPNGVEQVVVRDDYLSTPPPGFPEDEVWVSPYENWNVVASNAPSGPDDIIVNGEWIPDPVAVKARAKEKVLQDSIAAAASLVPELRHQVGIFFVWYEVQRLKLAIAADQVPADTESRRRQYPMIMALSFLSGATPQQVVTAVETRYWDRVKNMALFEARMMLGRDAVEQAATPQAAIQAAESIDWTPNAE